MEALMQYVWQFRLWPLSDMRTTDGRRIEVLQPGIHNKDAGPDFHNAKVIIDGQLWSGNIEIHVKASDWHRHKHDTDKAYDSVVLHVVEVDDAVIHRSNGEVIPQMVMTCAPDFADKYNALVNNPLRELQCGDRIASFSSLHLSDWFSALGFERLYDKADRIFSLLNRYGGSWADSIYATLARGLGFGTNADPFELLALSTPLKHMLHHADSVLTVEAILMGQAGMLEGKPVDPYHERLQNEYRFMCAKFGLQRSNNIYWKTARMRPQNSPYRRIAVLARLVAGNFPFSSQILEIKNIDDARALFDNLRLDGYWANHYNFSAIESPGSARALSRTSIDILLINVVVPIIFAYAHSMGDSNRQEIAVDMLSSLAPESNSIVEIFRHAGISPANAFDTQAIIQLRKNYCQPRKCLFCRIGHAILSSRVKRAIP